MRIALKLFAIAAVVMCTSSMALGDILVDFDSDREDGSTNGTNADFALFDPNVDPSATVDVVTPPGATTPVSVGGGTGISGLLTTSTGGNFAPGVGPTEGVPILDGFFSTNTMGGGPTSGVTSLSSIVGINAGDSVTLTVFSVGDQPNQTSTTLSPSMVVLLHLSVLLLFFQLPPPRLLLNRLRPLRKLLSLLQRAALPAWISTSMELQTLAPLTVSRLRLFRRQKEFLSQDL